LQQRSHFAPGRQHVVDEPSDHDVGRIDDAFDDLHVNGLHFGEPHLDAVHLDALDVDAVDLDAVDFNAVDVDLRLGRRGRRWRVQ
jgi:hypothetical protein